VIQEEYIELFKKVLGLLASCGIVIEFTPFIKLNPISWILKKMGSIMNEELYKRMDKLQEKMIDHEIDQLRWNILDFANSCRQGRRHTKEEFDHVISCHAVYEKILEENGRTNGQVDTDYKYIEKLYYKCMEDNDFL